MQNLFPIDHIREDIVRELKDGNRLILKAPTGSGKSTRVPQFLVDDVFPKGGQVVILQPRRMAARLLADYIAQQRNGLTGEEVGYQVRMEGQHGPATRILFLTEGILLKRLLNGDEMTGIAALIFDEFHERHLETDLGLALALLLQKTSRPDLKIVVMSATLETNLLQQYLEPCPVLVTEGKSYPVSLCYAASKPYENSWDHAARQLESFLPEWKEGSALIFMPGIYEIRKTIEAIRSKPRLQSIGLYPLHGSLSKKEQDEAVSAGEKRIIVTTNVAETSLTIPDIQLVIDSGLARVARFDPRRGINTLYLENISQSSASQRAGRAGRTAPGTCIRLWSEFSNAQRAISDKPEIQRVDISEAFLGLMARGFPKPQQFPWLEAPEKLMSERAMTLLSDLGAVDGQSLLTQLGRQMASLPMHPRLARMLLMAATLDCLPSASILAALSQSTGILIQTNDPVILAERGALFGDSDSDLLFEFNAWLWAGTHQFRYSDCASAGINATQASQVARLAVQILGMATDGSRDKHRLPAERLGFEEEQKLRRCILVAFLDFLAVRHQSSSATCQMMHGRGGQLHRDSSVKNARLFVATELEESKTTSGMQLILRKVTAVEEEWIRELSLPGWEEKVSYQLDTDTKRIVERVETCLNGLVLRKEIRDASNREECSLLLTNLILGKELDFPQWDEEVEILVRRVNFASKNASWFPIPAIDEEARALIIQQAIYSCKSLKDLQRADLRPALKDWLSKDQWKEVDRLAPDHIQLPSRRKPTRLRYDDKGEVIVSETVQGLYDCPGDLSFADGKVKPVFEILAPSRRPVQITRDLDQFWKNSYQDVKKELKGRYPKHEWR
jgi:ATP-dependent helicase HrpB